MEDVDHHSVGQEIALWITHHLMNFDNDFPFGRGRDLDGLDMWIDDAQGQSVLFAKQTRIPFRN